MFVTFAGIFGIAGSVCWLAVAAVVGLIQNLRTRS